MEKNENQLFINKDITNEFFFYGKYIKYVRKGLIQHQNYNWLILDSSHTLYKKVINQISSFNDNDAIYTNILKEIDYIGSKGEFKKDELKGAIADKLSDVKGRITLGCKTVCNVVVINSIIDEGIALQEFGDFCPFFVNLNTIKEEDKNAEIKQFLVQNNFTIESAKIEKELSNLSLNRAEQIMTRAFIKALNEKRNILNRQDLIPYTQETSNDILSELDNMIGLANVKQEVHQIYNYLLISKKKDSKICKNMLFLGNPGTGKTTIAQLIARLFSTIDNLNFKLPIVFESRETLVGSCIGEAEKNLVKAVNRAKNGIFFIDEAYSLSASDSARDYGYRIIDCLVNQMDLHKYDIMFIFAGYKLEMLDFLRANPGLQSRIPFKIDFPNYTEIELYEIFNKFAKEKHFRISNKAKNLIIEHFKISRKEKNFGNGRYSRNLFERVELKQANRLVSTGSNNINNIIAEDVINAIASIKEPQKNLIGFKTE